jgi:hypothetical protein
LPKKFGYDKQRLHFPGLILSGQLTRDEALQKLEEPLYRSDELENDITYFCKKLRITRDEFEDLIAQPNLHYTDFPNWDRQQRLLKCAQNFALRVTGKHLRVYS